MILRKRIGDGVCSAADANAAGTELGVSRAARGRPRAYARRDIDARVRAARGRPAACFLRACRRAGGESAAERRPRQMSAGGSAQAGAQDVLGFARRAGRHARDRRCLGQAVERRSSSTFRPAEPPSSSRHPEGCAFGRRSERRSALGGERDPGASVQQSVGSGQRGPANDGVRQRFAAARAGAHPCPAAVVLATGLAVVIALHRDQPARRAFGSAVSIGCLSHGWIFASGRPVLYGQLSRIAVPPLYALSNALQKAHF